jgi:tRNA(Ile)-lysidine synthase
MPGPAPAVAATRLAVRGCVAELTGTVVVAVSGGADSLALLAAVAFEGPKASVRVLAVTVDHGLQPGSADQAAAVLKQAAGLGVDAVSVQVAIGAAGVAGGPEAAARTARYAALREVAATENATAVLLGHTLDDQAETVLLGLARGSGARSLAGMREVNGLLRRPFLGLHRATTEAACAAEGLQPWHDPMNQDPAYTRVRVRTEVLPALELALGPGVAEALARTAEQLAQDCDALDGWAAAASADTVRADERGLDVDLLAALPPAVRARVLRSAALAAGVPGGSLGSAHLRELDRLVTAWHGQGPLALPGSVSAARDCGRLLLTCHR